MTHGFVRRLHARSLALVASVGLTCFAGTAVTAFADVPTKGTEILWDKYGIPHISAADHQSLFYAYGYAQMEAHSELLLRLYAQARGRGAEFYGDSYLEADRWVRTNGIPATAKKWAAGQSAEFAPLVVAFVAGLNAWAVEHKADVSPAARGVLPVSVEDVYAHCLRVIHYDWIVNPSKLDGRLRRADVDSHGSNEWAIAPSHSASGKTMLLSNSHLEWGDMHTYFEVQLTGPGVNSYGAVWVGFPVLRQCFNDYLGWTQTTNNPDESDLYRLTLKDGGYVLDGQVRQFDVVHDVIKVRQKDGTLRDEPITVRRTVHGPVVADRNGMTVAMRVAAIDRPRLFEQFWKMGLAHNFKEWEAAMKMQQLPLFNTAYADRDGHIAYVYNATLPVHPTGDYQYWQGVVPGDRSDLIASAIHPWEDVPKVVDPPTGFVQNSNDMPWTSVYPPMLDAKNFAPGYAAPMGITQRAQRGTRILSSNSKMTFADVKAGKLSTHMETADDFVDDIVATARKLGTDRAKRAADILEKWDRNAEGNSDGMLLFYRFMTAAGQGFRSIGGYKVPLDDRKPLETPRGFADPVKAAATLDAVAAQMEKDYGSLHVLWGDVFRFRRGTVDLPGNGAPSALGAIRTVDPGPWVNGKAEGVRGDTYFAVIEFSTPVHAEALLTYGNWSKVGSPHVEDQVRLNSKKEMRPVWRDRKEIEANLESRKVFQNEPAFAQQAFNEDFFTTSDGVKIHYLTAGTTGSWVVLIHGYSDNAERMWFRTGIAPVLARNHRIVALDNRNHGKSDKPQPGGSGKAQDIVELMDHLHIDRAHIHGYSMGGGITGQLLTMIPGRFISAGFGGSGIQEADPKLRAQAEAMDAALPKAQGDDAAAMDRFRSRVAQARPANSAPVSATPLEIDLSKLDVPILAVNGSFDSPYAKTQRIWREAKVFENVILPEKTHLTAISSNGAPALYIDSIARFIDAYDKR